ncbi:hypothetical protein [Sporosarcina sp. E16_8]|uniref:hypothetical protein n=1 Tax=Sporosarcina sp. E16_8 TaxID=2789295 RepID=UPI001A91F2B2|nr:hypothetical protein [Sporosarcina sp. E16_8]MBO0587606.1 hypothetical protein [Sporosarcina sp. E16_8]
MEELRAKKIINLLHKKSQLNPVRSGLDFRSPYVQNIIEKFNNNEYIVGPKNL